MLSITGISPLYWPSSVSPPGFFDFRFTFAGHDMQFFVKMYTNGVYIDLGVSLPEILITQAGGFCVGETQVPTTPTEPPEDVPECENLETCCSRFLTQPGMSHIYAGCMLDWSWDCCAEGANPDCCTPIIPNCKNGQVVCSSADRCDTISGVCVEITERVQCSLWGDNHVLPFNETESFDKRAEGEFLFIGMDSIKVYVQQVAVGNTYKTNGFYIAVGQENTVVLSLACASCDYVGLENNAIINYLDIESDTESYWPTHFPPGAFDDRFTGQPDSFEVTGQHVLQLFINRHDR
eukprot:UN31117